MLAKSVVFLPRLRGALAWARSPRRAHAKSEQSAVLEPISSTNTGRPASIPASPATSVLQAALRNSSRSSAPSDLFFGSNSGA